jgi:hypothetical protein
MKAFYERIFNIYYRCCKGKYYMNKYSIIGIASIAGLVLGIGMSLVAIDNAFAQATARAKNNCPQGGINVAGCVSASVAAELECIQANVAVVGNNRDNRNC